MNTALMEKDYNELYKYAMNIAYKFIGYNDSAYDIAQNAMLTLISTKTDVQSPYSWLRTVVKRESLKVLEEEKRNKDVIAKKHSKPVIRKEADEDLDTLPVLDDATVKKALTNEEYRIYNKMKKFKFNISKYAESEGLSYNTAAFHKKRIKRNLMATALWDDGWRFSTKILTFPQFNNITRFIRIIMKSIEDNKIQNLVNYLRGVDIQKIERIFSGIAECREWSICYLDNEYRLSLVCLTKDKQLKVPLFWITFDKRNYLHVAHVNEGEVLLCIPENKNVILENFMVKGKLDISIDELTDLLKYSK